MATIRPPKPSKRTGELITIAASMVEKIEDLAFPDMLFVLDILKKFCEEERGNG